MAAPAAVGRSNRMSSPAVSSLSSSDGRIRVSHREYIGEVTGQASFTAVSYAVNPGLSAVFAWLSNLAQNYESYLALALSFEFETQCSTSTAGSIQMAMDYDAADSAPATKQALMSYHNAVRAPVWGECRFICDSQDLRKFGSQRFIRTAALAANQDIKTYDIGNLIVATSGGSGTVVGELYVRYSFELMTPQTGVVSGSASITKLVGQGSITKAAVFGTAPTITLGTILAASSATNTLVFSTEGLYRVLVSVVGTGIQDAILTGTATAVPVGDVYGQAVSYKVSEFSVNVTAANQTIIFDYSSSTTVTASTVRVVSAWFAKDYASF